ncbi:MAG: hypothetical protein WCE40_07675 [Polyangia bacterium]|jgi:hypothetical protein
MNAATPKMNEDRAFFRTRMVQSLGTPSIERAIGELTLLETGTISKHCVGNRPVTIPHGASIRHVGGCHLIGEADDAGERQILFILRVAKKASERGEVSAYTGGLSRGFAHDDSTKPKPSCSAGINNSRL